MESNKFFFIEPIQLTTEICISKGMHYWDIAENPGIDKKLPKRRKSNNNTQSGGYIQISGDKKVKCVHTFEKN